MLSDTRSTGGMVSSKSSAVNSSVTVVSRGTEAIAAAVGEFVGRVGPVAVTLETADLWLLDDRAYETGEWSYTFTSEGEAKRTIGGRYVTIWQRQPDGDWKIWADMGVPGTSLSD